MPNTGAASTGPCTVAVTSGARALSLPNLVALEGFIDDHAINRAVASVYGGAYPEWCVLKDRRSLGLTTLGSWVRAVAMALETIVLLALGLAAPRAMGTPRTHLQVRSIVLEYMPTRQRVRLRFQPRGDTAWSRLAR